MAVYIKTLNSMTCMDSCVGMCRRILKDIHNSNMSKEELTEAYWRDKNQGGVEFETIIELGKFLEELKNNNK